MKHTTTIVCILLSGLLSATFPGCKKDDNPRRTIIGSGDIKTESLDLQAFHSIENTGVADFTVLVGGLQSVLFSAQDNVREVFTYEVIDSVLVIGIDENVTLKDTEDILFDITIPLLSSVEHTGAGDFELMGDYENSLDISLTGVGNVKAFDLIVGYYNIHSTGIGNCEVHVWHQLDVTVTGVGDVYYKGDPEVIQNVTGLGSVIRVN